MRDWDVRSPIPTVSSRRGVPIFTPCLGDLRRLTGDEGPGHPTQYTVVGLLEALRVLRVPSLFPLLDNSRERG